MEWPARLPPVGGGGVSDLATHISHKTLYHVYNKHKAERLREREGFRDTKQI